jgi:N-formylmaleamate deformylase
MQKWSDGYIDACGTKLHYYRSGGEKPSLVLVHGMTDDGLCWTPVAEILSKSYDTVMVDIRSHGKSEAPDDGYNYETMAKELSCLISKLGLIHPVIVGHSMGAMISLILAGLFPELPVAILLEDPPPLWIPPRSLSEEEEHLASMKVWIMDLKTKTYTELLAEAHQFNPDWSEKELEPWAKSKQRFNLKILSLINSEPNIQSGIPKIIKQITCPVLLITADTDRGAILTEADVIELQKLLPDLIVTNITGAGHNIRRNQFTSYMNVVKNFLSRHTN